MKNKSPSDWVTAVFADGHCKQIVHRSVREHVMMKEYEHQARGCVWSEGEFRVVARKDRNPFYQLMRGQEKCRLCVGHGSKMIKKKV